MSRDSDGATFPVRQVASIDPRPPDAAWLVEQLWALQGVGIVGGVPKSCKTWLGCELALAVATGSPALGRFAVKRQGPVLFFGAEDDAPSLRARFDAISRARAIALTDDTPVFLLDTPALRLEREDHLDRLRRTIEKLAPVLVVLDPFVRIARVDENSASEVSAVLGSLRTIQRDLATAVLLAHHMRKSPAGHLGYQLRGSGDFAAWYDSALYLTRCEDDFVLAVEHRSAAAPSPVRLRLERGETPHLVVLDEPVPQPDAGESDSLRGAILERLAKAPRPLTTAELRDSLKVRKQSVVAVLQSLAQAGLVRRVERGWALT